MKRSARAVLAGALALAVATVGMSGFAAAAGSKKEREEMMRALTPHGEAMERGAKERITPRAERKHRSGRSAANRKEMRMILDSAGRRGTIVEERERLHDLAMAEELPSLNLEIYFAKDSDRIDRISIARLEVLGDVMSDPAFRHSRFLIFGHTDASGSDRYNLDLSRRRAASVRRFLEDYTGISWRRMIAVGYGEEKLKNRYDPYARENRRVQIVNFTD